jgi:hypothetical protein
MAAGDKPGRIQNASNAVGNRWKWLGQNTLKSQRERQCITAFKHRPVCNPAPCIYGAVTLQSMAALTDVY